MLPSSGDAWIGQKHILTEQKSVRRLIGYCPQHDALLDLLTVRDHLLLFGRLKGVSKQRLPGLVQKLLLAMRHEISNGQVPVKQHIRPIGRKVQCPLLEDDREALPILVLLCIRHERRRATA